MEGVRADGVHTVGPCVFIASDSAMCGIEEDSHISSGESGEGFSRRWRLYDNTVTVPVPPSTRNR